jgi:hypothetical protein
MKEFSKLKYFEEKNENELIDSFIFEALKDTNFDYYYNYDCQASKTC